MPSQWGESGRKRENSGERWLKKEESGVKWGTKPRIHTASEPGEGGAENVSRHPRTAP